MEECYIWEYMCWSLQIQYNGSDLDPANVEFVLMEDELSWDLVYIINKEFLKYR